MAVSFLYILRLMENYIKYSFWQDCKRISRTPEFRGWFESAVSNVQLLLLPECEDLAFFCSLLVQAGPFRLRNLLKFIILIFSWRVFDLSSVCFSLSTTCITSRYGRFVLIHFSPNEKLIQYKSMIPQTKGKFPMQFRSKSDGKNAFATQKPLLRVVPPPS